MLRGLFLLAIMYPAMLLVIPVYIVVYKLGLLGGYLGIVLFLALGPVQFFLFEQFFRDMPASVLEAAAIDGANEWQVLFRVVVPIARPVMVTVAIISFLLNWSQWFPVLVISATPDTYTSAGHAAGAEWGIGREFPGHDGAGCGDHCAPCPAVSVCAAACGGRDDGGGGQRLTFSERENSRALT